MTSIKYILLSFLLLGLVPNKAEAAPDKVAKVIIMRGEVEAKTQGSDVKQLKKGMWLPEGTIVKTSSKSFVKLLFTDKSQMNLGPESQMKITAFPKNDAGIITLMKGQLRSKVTKDYMGIENKDKSKLFIKTKTAAMGVRGTDFQVVFNPRNNATALVTFEGAVAMAQINQARQNVRTTQKSLERMVSGDRAVMVKRGQYSGSNPKQLRATTPVKINPVQLKAMEKNDGQASAGKNKSHSNKRNFRSIIPRGLDSKEASVGGANMDGKIAGAIGSRAVASANSEAAKLNSQSGNSAPSEGKNNQMTGERAPKAGGYIDANTGLYIPPPEGSAYDPVTDTYVPPPSYGAVGEGGDWVPVIWTLTDEGKAVAIPDPERRGPADEGNPPDALPDLPECVTCAPEPEQPEKPTDPDSGCPPGDPRCQIDLLNPDNPEPPPPMNTNTKTRVKFIFDSQ